MLTKNINFKNFLNKKNSKKIKNDLNVFLKENTEIYKSLSTNYRNNYSNKIIKKLKKYFDVRIIGMGGSILGTEAIYDFLKNKIKKNFYFVNNIKSKINSNKKKNYFNLIVSKSGSTLETISNANIIIKKKDTNVLITEDKKSYLWLEY